MTQGLITHILFVEIFLTTEVKNFKCKRDI